MSEERLTQRNADPGSGPAAGRDDDSTRRLDRAGAGAESAGTSKPGGGGLVGDPDPAFTEREHEPAGQSADGLDEGQLPAGTRSTIDRDGGPATSERATEQRNGG